MAHNPPKEMIARLEESRKHFDFLTAQLSQPSVINDRNAFQKHSKERSDIEPMIEAFDSYLAKLKHYLEAKDMQANEKDAELQQIASDEAAELEPLLEIEIKALELLLLPKDPNDEKNTVVEIRAGVGGDEAALFAEDLYRMYSTYAEKKRWRTEILSIGQGTAGGFKEIIFSIEGERVYSHLKYETGVHRVQRVPKTEANGRVHTSTATVAVLPEAEEVDIQIAANDLRIDVFRAGGNGGQSVNTTDSAVRITHLPTNTVVICQDEKSQLKNKNKAMKVLRSRLYEVAATAQHNAIASERRSQIGTGMRNERIRTYSYPQGRVTDHRIGMTTYNLSDVITGDVDAFIKALTDYYQTLQLKGIDPANAPRTQDLDDA